MSSYIVKTSADFSLMVILTHIETMCDDTGYQ